MCAHAYLSLSLSLSLSLMCGKRRGARQNHVPHVLVRADVSFCLSKSLHYASHSCSLYPPPFTTTAARSTATPTRGCAPLVPQRGHSEASLYPASAHRSQKVCPHVNMISKLAGWRCRACAVAAVALPRYITLSALHWHPLHFTSSIRESSRSFIASVFAAPTHPRQLQDCKLATQTNLCVMAPS